MADSTPSLHIDDDWKKQAQEEKKRLAEQAEKQKPQPAAAPAASATASSTTATGTRPRTMPPASFATLTQSIVTQALYYLGDLAVRGAEPVINLDMAKHHIDTLAVLEEKTANNLSPEERKLLDAAIYEARMRYISVASQYLGP